MAALPPDQRRAIELRIVEDLAYEEMAAVLAVSEQVARARVSRALRALARMLRDGVKAKDAAA